MTLPIPPGFCHDCLDGGNPAACFTTGCKNHNGGKTFEERFPELTEYRSAIEYIKFRRTLTTQGLDPAAEEIYKIIRAAQEAQHIATRGGNKGAAKGFARNALVEIMTILMKQVEVAEMWGEATGEQNIEKKISSPTTEERIAEVMGEWHLPQYVPKITAQLMKAIGLDIYDHQASKIETGYFDPKTAKVQGATEDPAGFIQFHPSTSEESKRRVLAAMNFLGRPGVWVEVKDPKNPCYSNKPNPACRVVECENHHENPRIFPLGKNLKNIL